MFEHNMIELLWLSIEDYINFRKNTSNENNNF